MLEKLAGLVPAFLDRLLRLAASPTGFLTALEAESAARLKAALAFYLVCIALSVALAQPVAGGGLEASLARSVLSAGLVTVAAALVILLAWRLVGGTARFRTLLVASLHVLGVAAVIPALGSLVAYALFTAFQPDQAPLYREYMERLVLAGTLPGDARFQPLRQGNALELAMGAYTAGQLLTVAWVAWCWPGYRALNGVGTRRAVLALAVTLVLSLPLAWLGAQVQRSLGLGVF